MAEQEAKTEAATMVEAQTEVQTVELEEGAKEVAEAGLAV